MIIRTILIPAMLVLAAGCVPAATGPVELRLDSRTAHNLSITPTGDTLALKITGEDPYVSAQAVSVQASTSDVVQIRYRSKQTYTAELYWATTIPPNYGMDKQASFTLPSTEVQGTGALEWSVAEVPIGLLSTAWSGTITQVRFDPSQDASSGELEVAWIRISSSPKAKMEVPRAKKGEYVSEVNTGVDASRGVRFVQDSGCRVETSGAGLRFSTLDKDSNPTHVADLSFRADKGPGTIALDSKEFPKDSLYCRFQDRWRTQVLSLFYRTQVAKPTEKIDARFDVGIDSGHAPWFRISRPGTIVVESVEKPSQMEITKCEAQGGSFETGVLKDLRMGVRYVRFGFPGKPSLYVLLDRPKIEEMTFGDRRVEIRVAPGQRIALYVGDDPTSELDQFTEQPVSYAMEQPRSVTLNTGITAVDARIVESSGKKRTTIESPVAFSTVVSSDYVDVNLPVGVPEARVALERDARVTRVTDAVTGEAIPYSIDGRYVVLKSMPARTVRIKCDRLLDFRVMWNAPTPVDAAFHYEDITNYYYPQWVFLWNDYLDASGKTKLDPWPWLIPSMRDRPLPIFVGLHYGNHGPKGSYDTFHKLHPDIFQIDNHGKPHQGMGGQWPTPPWMCLVHPTLWKEISDRFVPMFGMMKSQPYWSRIWGLGSTSEPWIVRDDNDPNTIFCYNPEHIKWFRRFEKDKWQGDLKAFNGTFGTSFESWDAVEPPRVVEKSAYYNEWLLSKAEAVIASEDFYRKEIHKHAPDRPNFAHIAIVVEYNQIRNSDTPDIMQVGKDISPSLFKQGGSLYVGDPGGIAFIVDSIRSLDTDIASFPECYAPSYNLAYSYLVGSSGLIKQTFNLMISGTSWESAMQVGDGWQTFAELMHFLCLDLGEVERPKVGVVFDYLSDNHVRMREAHGALFTRNIDRCVLTTRMIEHGYLRTHPLDSLVLPGVSMVSEKALIEVEAAMKHGMKVALLGDFAKTDCYYRTSPEFARARDFVLSKALMARFPEDLAGIGSPSVESSEKANLVIYKKTKGVTLYNRWASRLTTLGLPASMQTSRIAVVSDTGQVVLLRNPSKELAVPMRAMSACSVVEVGSGLQTTDHRLQP